MVDTGQLKPPSPWVPIIDLVDLKHLGKLGEETGELSAAVARCIIQGLRNGEAEPVTGKLNKEWLEDEIADVRANIMLVSGHFSLDEKRIAQRMAKKIAHLRVWHSMEHMKPDAPNDCDAGVHKGHPIASSDGVLWSCCGATT